MTRLIGKLAISSIFSHARRSEQVGGGTEGYPACGGLCPPCGGLKKRAGTPIERIADIDAWRPEASMPGWPGWLACLAWLGWLGWIGWNDCLKSSTLDAPEEVGGFKNTPKWSRKVVSVMNVPVYTPLGVNSLTFATSMV